jgi:hypothetical protein
MIIKISSKKYEIVLLPGSGVASGGEWTLTTAAALPEVCIGEQSLTAVGAVVIILSKSVSTSFSNCDCGGEEFLASCAAVGGSSLSAVAAVESTLSERFSTSFSNGNCGSEEFAASWAAGGGSSLSAVAAVRAASGEFGI